MPIDRPGIRRKMKVYDAEGRYLGKVIQTGADAFAYEKGFFFPKARLVPYSIVSTIDWKNRVHLKLTTVELREPLPRAPVQEPESQPEAQVLLEDVEEVVVVEHPSDRVDLRVTTKKPIDANDQAAMGYPPDESPPP